MFPNLKEDIKRYLFDRKVNLKRIFYLLSLQGIWVTVVYRFGYWVHHHFKIPMLRFFLKVIAFVAFKLTEIITGISIPFSVKIGKGLYIGHFGGIFLNGKTIIGDNCSIGSGVVIGTKGLGNQETPIIGNNVFIGVGAKVLGGIKIGDNVKIGANAVVVYDIPDNATAVGIPAKIIKQETTKE